MYDLSESCAFDVFLTCGNGGIQAPYLHLVGKIFYVMSLEES